MANEVSTQENCNWLVQVGKKELTLNQDQYNLLVKADQAGNIKMVHFKDFSINLSYLSYMEKIKKAKVEELPDSTISEEQAKFNREKIMEMKKNVLGF